MGTAYIDTSVLVAIGFREEGASALARRMSEFDALVSSNLLEAELRAAYRRLGVVEHDVPLRDVHWVHPDRALSFEIERVLAAGYVRGADCWHLATALYFADLVGTITFLTVDKRQQAVARTLGFQL